MSSPDYYSWAFTLIDLVMIIAILMASEPAQVVKLSNPPPPSYT